MCRAHQIRHGLRNIHQCKRLASGDQDTLHKVSHHTVDSALFLPVHCPRSLPRPTPTMLSGFDCNKPYCSIPDNVKQFPWLRNPFCEQNNAVFDKPWQKGFYCWDQTPWLDRLTPYLSYGFAGAAAEIGHCGELCYEIEFTGRGHAHPDDPGSMLLLGKRMVVQVNDIASDGVGGHFSLAIPGGGVDGAERCSYQWGAQQRKVEVGVMPGGFLAQCQDCDEFGKNCRPRRQAHEETQRCVRERCIRAFEDPTFADLRAACEWYSSFLMVADTPEMRYRKVKCPKELDNRLWRRGIEGLHG